VDYTTVGVEAYAAVFERGRGEGRREQPVEVDVAGSEIGGAPEQM
jgi:hypothetical protein